MTVTTRHEYTSRQMYGKEYCNCIHKLCTLNREVIANDSRKKTNDILYLKAVYLRDYFAVCSIYWLYSKITTTRRFRRIGK